MSIKPASFITLAIVLALPLHGDAQGRGGRGGAPQAPQVPRAAAPLDLTGYWVAVVTEEWRFRMVTPNRGDYQGVPMNEAARKVADAWNPEADTTAGLQCKSYGAPMSFRNPTRINITWQDDQTLKVDFDAGMQTRLFHFQAPAEKSAPSWQGVSVARWERPLVSVGRFGGNVGPSPRGGWLKVITSNLRAGYLRKNGVPFSEGAMLTEYFDLAALPNDGTPILMVTSIVEDPMYLNEPFVVTSQFKKQANASGWDPTPCSSTW